MTRTMLAALALIASGASPQAEPSGRSADAQPAFVEPADAPLRHCSGACVKSGSLQWFCKPAQTCSLDCGTAPPRMHCHDPKR